MMNNRTKVEFLSKLENVMFSRTVVVGFLVDVNPSMNFINELKTVVSEAVTNAIVHGYEEREDQTILLEVSYDDTYVYLSVEDFGMGIADIEKAKEPLYSSKLEEERAGLGFTIMEVFTDEMKIESLLGERNESNVQEAL